MVILAVAWRDSDTGASIEKAGNLGEIEIFAVRFAGSYCLSKTAGWVYEPRPSERDESFLQDCRWHNFDEAVDALKAVGCTPLTQ